MTQNKTETETETAFHPRITKVKGEDAWYVQSASNPKDYHRVTLATCDCKSFQYRNRCKHLDLVYNEIEIQGEEK